jgi:hypothetical protein
MSSIGDMFSGSTGEVNYTKASAQDLSSDIGNLLQAYQKTQPGVLSFERKYRPKYAALNLQDIGQYATGYAQLGGQLGLQGVSQVQQARMGELYGQGQLASGARGIMQTLSPEQAALVEQGTQRAESAYAGSQYLTPEETRQAQQAAREASSARGMLGSQGSIASEILSRESYKQSKRAEADQARANAYNLAQGFYQTPGMSLISQTPYGLQLGSSYLTSGQQSLGASTPQLFSSDTALNIGAAERGNVLSASTATAANKAAITGATISGISNIASSILKNPDIDISDRNAKTDIKKVGKTNSGLPIYTFKYKGDNKTKMGVMAQDVEKKNPKAVGLINGIKGVDYSKIK